MSSAVLPGVRGHRPTFAAAVAAGAVAASAVVAVAASAVAVAV